MTSQAGYNIAIMTGDVLVVIDIDNKGDGVNANHAALISKYGKLPRTVRAETPSGGMHLYFRVPKGVYIPNSQSKLADHVDVRGHRGYVVAPGSSIDGEFYRWAEGRSPAEVEIADLPPGYLRP